MTTTPLLLASAFALFLSAAPSRAAEPAPAKLTPEIQALLADLLKAAEQAAPEAVPVPEPAPAIPAAPREGKPALGSASNLKTGSLTTGGLAGGSLAPSASLGGRGTSGGFSRLSASDWRLLFPTTREDRR